MIHILDHQHDQIIDTLQNKANAQPFFDDTHTATIKNEEHFHFSTPYDGSGHLTARNRIVIPDEDGHYREFIIDETVKAGTIKEVYTRASFRELKKQKVITPRTLDGQTVDTALDFTLDGTEWKRGITEFGGSRSFTIEQHTNPFEFLKQIAAAFDMELRFRVEIRANRIVARYVDLIKKQGAWRGKEIELGKDLIDVKRTEKGDIVTALMCVGPEREDGTRLTVEIKDEKARERWGRNGQHLWDVYEPQTEDQDMTLARLRSLGETELSKRINTVVQYEADQASIEHVFGFEHEKVRLGDTTRVKDTSYSPPLYLEARVISIERSLSNPSQKKYILGDFIDFREEDVMARFRLLQKVIAQKVSEQQLLERTYSKTEIDHKDQGVYQDGTVYADQRSDQVKQEASEDATQKAGQAKDEAKAHADDKAHQAEENAKDYTDFVDQNVRQYTDAEILATEIALLQELADKAGLEYVNGQLQLKANQNDFNFLSADVDTHNSKIGSLQDMASNLQGEINAIEGELVTLRSTVNDDISSLQSAASSLLQRANEQESALASASGRIVTVEENIDTINGTMSTTINELTSINGIVSEHQTTIQQHAGLISEKASLTVVDTINDKVSTVEASVETIAGQVSLKANAEEVYTKSEVNTELGKKVDTTVYNSQMTQLDVKVDGVTADIRSVQSEVSDVDTRLISAQTQLNMQAGLIDAKAERSELTTVDGKVTGVRNDLTTLQFSHNGLNSTVSSLRNDFDGLEIGGRNMLRNSSANNVIPRLVANVTTALSGITRTFVEDYTVLTINRSTSSDNFFQIGSTAQSDEQGFVNGQTYAISFDAYIPSSNAALPIIFTFNYETSYAQKRFTISGIEFNKWKRYKVIIDFNQSNGLGKFFRIRLPSTQIGDFICIKNIKLEKGNKSTDWSPAPEDIDSAIYTIEEFASRIDQKADSIATSVSSLTQTVNNQGSSLSSIQTQVTQQAGLIDQRVTKTEYTADQNGVITRLDNAESVQQQHATLISQRVTETVFNDGLTGLESRLSTAETNITQKADRVDLTSTQTSVDSLTNRMSQAESSLSVQSDRIDQKVDVDGVIAAINVSVDEINGARINLVGAVNVLSDITGNLGTITAGRLEAVEIIGATGTFSGKIVTPIAYFESPTLSERVSLAIQRLSFSPTQHAGYFKLEQMPNVSNTLELSVADSNMMTIPNSAHLRINGQVEVSGLIRSDARVRTEFGLEGSRFWSLHNPSNAILQVNTNGSVAFNADGGILSLGNSTNTSLVRLDKRLYFGGQANIWHDDGSSEQYLRIYAPSAGDHHIRIRQDGQIAFYANGAFRHIFNASGTKTGGTIEIDGQVHGMSPIDSPQVLIEYIIFDQQVNGDETILFIDERFLKAVNYKYAVFPSSPCEIEKRKDTFVVTSKEAKEIDFRLVGIRAGEENTFWIYSEDDVA